jgi:hypothetical protein
LYISFNGNKLLWGFLPHSLPFQKKNNKETETTLHKSEYKKNNTKMVLGVVSPTRIGASLFPSDGFDTNF